MSERRVLHVVDSLGLGGTQTILKDYFEAKRGDPGLRLYGLRSLPMQMEIAHPNVEVHPASWRFSLRPLLDLRRIVREHSIRVLHCHLFRAQVFGFLVKLLFAPRLTLIFHEHGRAVGREGESGLEAFLFRSFLRLAWRRVDRFVCISELTLTHLLQVIPSARDRSRVVANPIPVTPANGIPVQREETRRKLGIPDGAFVVGFASRLVERKGWADFLAAMALLAPRLPVYFLLAGDGEDRARAEARIAELSLAASGRMLGHIGWMADFYNCLDCFVMPSHWEPHGLTHLEAQSFGVPVIVSDVPGLSDTVHGDVDALLFEGGNVELLANAIERLAGDTAMRCQLIAGGLANARRYSMTAFAAALEAIYADVAPAAGVAVEAPAPNAGLPPGH